MKNNNFFDKLKVSDETEETDNVDQMDSKVSLVDRLSNPSDNKEEEQEDNQQEEQEEEYYNDNSQQQEVEYQDDNQEEVDDISFSPFVNHLVDSGLLYVDPEKEYEDSEEGFQEIIQDTVDSRINEWKGNLGDNALRLIDYLENNGTVEGFVDKFNEVNYSEIDLDDDDNKRELVKEYLMAIGTDDEDVKDLLKEYEDSGMMERQAKVSQKYLANHQNKERELFVENQKQQEIERRQNSINQLEEFKEDIYNNNFQSFEIPRGERDKFYNYLSKPVTKDGKTQYQSEDNYEDRIKMAYLKFKNFEFKDLEKKADTRAAISLKKELSRFSDPNARRVSGINNEEKAASLKIPGYFANNKGSRSDEI